MSLSFLTNPNSLAQPNQRFTMEDHINHLLRSTAEDEPSDSEESLSLRDLPLTPSSHSSTTVDLDHHRSSTSSFNHSRRSSPDFFFEFLVNRDDNDNHVTSPADDVIFRGRLLPFNPPPPRRSFSLSSATTRAAMVHRSESQLTESFRRETRSIRPSRSLDGRKLGRDSSSKSYLFSRILSKNNRNYSDPKPSPPWYWLVLGIPAKIPAEMELKDIKNRQIRRSFSPTSFFSGQSERFSGDRSSSTSWKLLSVLSCKSHTSADVIKTTSFHSNYSVRNM